MVGTVLFPHSSAALQGRAILVIAGLPVGALYALSPLFWAFAAFSLPILVPATLYHLLADVTEPRIVGFGLGLLTATFIATAFKLQRVNTDSLRLRIEREDIAEERERARQAAETANHAK
ncbi:MAG: hypothetical protein MZU95_13930, partial [Desulfomicrobium escambiense]|nr:hypothetical protein [Desulfomicrobium escambiense]